MKNLHVQNNNRAEKETRWKNLLRKYEERNLLLKKQEQALRLQFQMEQSANNDQPSIHLHDSNLVPTKDDENIDYRQRNQNSLQFLSHLGYAVRKHVPSLPLISAKFQGSQKRLNISNKELNRSLYEEDCLEFQKPSKMRKEKKKYKCENSGGKGLSKCELAQCKERHDKSDKYAKQLNDLKFELATTIQSLRGLESVNTQLRNEMCLLKDKSKNVTKRFIDTKLNEAHAIAKVKEKLMENKKYFDDNASLCMLARRVSETLMEMANFTEVDLAEVEQRIENVKKEEAELLAKPKPSRKNSICICSGCCTCAEDLKREKLRAERIKQILSEKRDACTTKSFGVIEDMLPDLEGEPVKVIRGIELACDNIGQGGGGLLDKLRGIELEEQLESGAIIELIGDFDEQGEETEECELDEFGRGLTGELAELEEDVRNIIREDLLDFPSDYAAGQLLAEFVPERELLESTGGPQAVDERDLISEADRSVLGDRSGYGDDESRSYAESLSGYAEGPSGYAGEGQDYQEGAPGYAGGGLDYTEGAPTDYTAGGPDGTGYDDTGAPGYPGEGGLGPDSGAAAGQGFAEDATSYAGTGAGYAEEGPGGGGGGAGAGAGPGEGGGREFTGDVSGFGASGVQPSEGAGGYAGEGGPSGAGGGGGGAGADYGRGGPDAVGAGREGAPDITGGGPYPSGGEGPGAAYAEGTPGGGPAAAYAEGTPGGGPATAYAEGTPGGGPAAAYAEGTPGGGPGSGPGAGPEYGGGGSDIAGVGHGPTESDITGAAGVYPSGDGSGFAGPGAESASDYADAGPDAVGAGQDGGGASESYAESGPSYTSGGPGFMEDASISESDAGYDQTKPSYSEDGKEMSEMASISYDDERNLSEADSSLYGEQGSTGEGEGVDSAAKLDTFEADRIVSESGESISTKASEEGRGKEEEHPPGCECVDCICTGVIEEKGRAAIEKTVGGLETIDEERLEEDAKPGRTGGEKFVDEDGPGIRKKEDLEKEKADKTKESRAGISPDIVECSDKGTCTNMDDILKLLSSMQQCSCATQERREKPEKKERQPEEPRTCLCTGEGQRRSSSSECMEPETCVVSGDACKEVFSQILDNFMPFHGSHGETEKRGEGVADLSDEIGPDDYSVTTAIADSGTIEIITEGPDGVIETSVTYTPSGNIDVKTEITEYECPVKEECLAKARESEIYADITEPFETGGPEDADEIARDVADALNRANQEVMDALSRANQSVTDAMEKANRDVESALAMVMARGSSSPMGSLLETSEKAVQEEDGGGILEESGIEPTDVGEIGYEKESGEISESAYGEEGPGRGREDAGGLEEYGEGLDRGGDGKQLLDDEGRPIRDAEKGEKEWEDSGRGPGGSERAGEEGWKGGDEGPGADRGGEKYDAEGEGGAGMSDRGRDGEGWENNEGMPGGGREKYYDEGEGGAGIPDRARVGGDEGDDRGSGWGGETGGEREGGEGKPDTERGGEYENDRGAQERKGGENEWDDEDKKIDRDREDFDVEEERSTKAWEDERGYGEAEAQDETPIGGERYVDEEEGEVLSTIGDTPMDREDEAGECTCEECLNKEPGVLGGGDCTCTAECKCPICTDLNIIEKDSRRTTQHPIGCTCIDCLCREDLQLRETLDIHKKHPPDCDCITCICGPGDPDKSKKQCHPPDCECLQCICLPPDTTKELICKISVKFSEHPENCDCIDCICSKGIEVTEETGIGDTCIYSDMKMKDVELQAVKSAGDFVVETPCDHKPGCDCLECICETFESRIAKKLERSKSKCAEPQVHEFNCECLECICKVNETPSLCHSHESHSENCNCVHCLCEGEREITTQDIEEEFERKKEIVSNIRVRSQCPYPSHPTGCTCTENYLKRSFGYETKPSECPCSRENLQPEILTLKMPAAEQIEVTDVKRISSDSLLIKWTECAVNETTGYEIFVNGVSKSRVYTKFRTAAVLTSLTFHSDLDIKVYATYYGGYLEPPAKAVFEVPNCDSTKMSCKN